MTETVAPNPASPFADADPNYRHILEAIRSVGTPAAGTLATTSCEGLAVVPDGELRRLEQTLPDGLCPTCIRVSRGHLGDGERPEAADCTICGALTRHNRLCVQCRQAAHTAWKAAGQPWRALTIKQPWADAIVQPSTDPKRVDNRTWPAPEAHVGTRILIHAGQSNDRSAILPYGHNTARAAYPDVRGAILATAVLAGCHFDTGSCCGTWAQREVFHWELADVRPLEVPVPVRGALQLWKPPVDVLAAVVDQKSARTLTPVATTVLAEQKKEASR